MPILVIDKQYQDGSVLTEDNLDKAFSSITTLVNVTGLGADNIQDNSISATEIQNNAITEPKLANNSVSANKIQDGSISMQKLASALRKYLVPVGSIMPFAGEDGKVPDGWKLCDGTSLSRTLYPELYATIGISFGTTSPSEFSLPDLRGLFLRGKLGGRGGYDLDVSSRTASGVGGDGTGNKVGSLQGDQLKQHNHSFYVTRMWGSGGVAAFNGSDGGGIPAGYSGSTNNTGGSETRPVNIYVNYIIKY